MDVEQILKIRKEILAEREAFHNKQDAIWTNRLREFEEANCPYKVNQVVELPKAKKYKRMVVYKIRTMFWDGDFVMIMLHGWYLDKENKPVKWEEYGISVFGVSNPTELKLSDNQTHSPVPARNN